MKENTAEVTLAAPVKEAATNIDSHKNSSMHREPILHRKDSLEKVINVLDSRSFKKPQPSTSRSQCHARLPKDKLILNSETLLILNLLGMDSDVREEYLIEVAKQRKLLLTNSKTNQFNVNPELFNVNNVPQVVDFVHQFHGKPIPSDDEMPTSVSRKMKQKVKKKEKKTGRTMVFENQKMNIVETSEVNQPECSVRSSLDRGSVTAIKKKSNKPVFNETPQMPNSFKASAQSASMSQLNKIIDKHFKKPRTLSACEQPVPGVLQVDAHRQSVDEEFSKRQQKRLRQKLRAMSLECTLQANAEKPPRKRGSRGSKKMSDPLLANQQQQPTAQSITPLNASMPKTDVAAKNLIRNKCSQINVKILEKLNQCAKSSAKPGPSTSNQIDDLVVESIDRAGDNSDEEDNDSSSVTSDSSNFPNDEETTSYFAKSDDMESSCNEKRGGSSVKAGPTVERSVLKKDNTAVSSE